MSAEPPPDEILQVCTTVADEAAGRALARALVQERLAACVQLEPLAASVYRWEGRVHEDAEWRLLSRPTRSARARWSSPFGACTPTPCPNSWPSA